MQLAFHKNCNLIMLGTGKLLASGQNPIVDLCQGMNNGIAYGGILLLVNNHCSHSQSCACLRVATC